MTDVALLWSDALGGADFALSDGQLVTDDGLRTAILISLFTDAQARVDDVLPSGTDRRGWWGDAFAPNADRPSANEVGDQTGGRLWLLEREKITAAVLTKAEFFAREALAWLIEDDVATRIEVETRRLPSDTLGIGVELWRPDGTRQRYDFTWEASV